MKYVVIKTSYERIDECGGSIFEAARGPWRIGRRRYPTISSYTHAVILLRGDKDIKAIFKIDKWYPAGLDANGHDRYVFAGEVDKKLSEKLVGRIANRDLFKKGRQFPLIYLEDVIDLIDL